MLLLLKYKKAIAFGLAASLLILLALRINHWHERSKQLDALIEQVAATNALNEKTATIGLELDNGLNKYRHETRSIDTPTGAVFTPDSVQRIRKRTEALGAARRNAGM